jgi:CRAL/TRIO domain
VYWQPHITRRRWIEYLYAKPSLPAFTIANLQIVGAPAFFPTVWEWIKRWFDPITVSKIFILSEAQAYKTLSSFIDPENIPQKYGGKLPFEFGGGPILDPYLAERLHFNKPDQPWPRGPLKWERQGGQDVSGADPRLAVDEDESIGTWKLIAVGSEHGKGRHEHIATFSPDPVPAVEEDLEIDDEAPDLSIDFATQKIKVNPRASWASASVHSRTSWASANSNPPSPTAMRPPSTSGSLTLSRSATQNMEKSELAMATPAEGEEVADVAGETGAGPATDETALNKENGDPPGGRNEAPTAKSGNVPAASGEAAKLPPSATRPGDVPLDAMTTELPNEKKE